MSASNGMSQKETRHLVLCPDNARDIQGVGARCHASLLRRRPAAHDGGAGLGGRRRQARLREAGCTPKQEARQLILEAALELVGRDGLAELSMDELAAAAGVSRA